VGLMKRLTGGGRFGADPRYFTHLTHDYDPRPRLKGAASRRRGCWVCWGIKGSSLQGVKTGEKAWKGVEELPSSHAGNQPQEGVFGNGPSRGIAHELGQFEGGKGRLG